MKDSSDASLVAEATDAFLAAMRAGDRPDVDDFIARYPQVAPVLRDMLPALMALDGSRMSAASELESNLGPIADELPLRQVGDFRLRQEVGRGGMGVVYEAWQVSLDRRVALKVLPFAAALDSRQLQRFKNEAQAAAQLHHTHIVPVYAVGSERGVHYYAMQFIDGQTVGALIDELRAESGLDHSESAVGTLPPLAAAMRSGQWAPAAKEDVEGTTPFAVESPPAAAPTPRMSDVTPGLGAGSTQRSARSGTYFRTVARLISQAADALEHAHGCGIVHRDVKPGNLMVDVRGHLWVADFGLAQMQTDSRLTMTGDLVGTLRYMSPEQILGGRIPIDHRSDVYSLGCTMYELLTLQPAFAGNDRRQLLQRISFDESPAPRRVNRAIPAELETIVIKAMSKNPADRYATAHEMGEDLERFLRDEPVRARRPTLRQHIRKWAYRHRGVVLTGSILGVLLLAAVAVGAVVVATQQRQLALTQANSLAVERKAKQRAQQVVDDYFTKISQEVLLSQPGMQPLRKDLMQRAREYYQTFADESGDDPALSAEIAETSRRLGQIAGEMGQVDEAERHFQEAVKRFDRLKSDREKDNYAKRDEMAMGFASSLTGLARIRAARGQFDRATADYGRAIAELSSLIKRRPDHLESRKELGIAQQNLAMVDMQLGQVEKASGEFDDALHQLRLAAEGRETDYSAQDSLAGCIGNLGMFCLMTGKFDEALGHYQEALRLREKMLITWPGRPQIESGIARYWHGLAGAHSELGRLPEAIESLGKAQSIRERVARQNPRVSEYREQWARGFGDLSTEQRRAGQKPEALISARRGLDVHRELAAEAPAVHSHRLGVAQSLIEIAILEADLGNFSQARDDCRQAVVTIREVVDTNPNVSDFLSRLGEALLRLADGAGILADCDEQRSAAIEAIGIYERLIGKSGESGDSGQPNPHRQDLVDAWHQRALADSQAGNLAESALALRQAIALDDESGADPKAPPSEQTQLVRNHAHLGTVLLRQGESSAATVEFDLAREIAAGDPALLWAMSRELGRAGSWLPEDTALREAVRAEVFRALEAAVVAGFNDVDAVRNERSLTTVRDDPRFQAIVEKANALRDAAE